jgi:hypothetical protein
VTNYIRVSLNDEGCAILTTVIADQPLSWITYDAGQLDDLISILCQIRDRMRTALPSDANPSGSAPVQLTLAEHMLDLTERQDGEGAV